MKKRILRFNNEEDKQILTQKSQAVEIIDEDIKNLIQDMKDTLDVSDGNGISAIQIGVPKQICICRWGGKDITMINPTITRTRGQKEFVEGCLSLPLIYKKVSRFQKVWCSYTDENGNQQEIADGGRMSDIIQHELDHFNGECKIYSE